MTKSRSTGGACPLIPLASLVAKPRVRQSLLPHQQEAKASYMGKSEVDGTGMFTPPMEVQSTEQAII